MLQRADRQRRPRDWKAGPVLVFMVAELLRTVRITLLVLAMVVALVLWRRAYPSGEPRP